MGKNVRESSGVSVIMFIFQPGSGSVDMFTL